MLTTATSHIGKTHTAIYRKRGYHIRYIDSSLTAPHIFDKACHRHVINVHALLKHYIDDHYEFVPESYRHTIKETMIDANTMLVTVTMVRKNGDMIHEGRLLLERIPLTFTIK